MARKPEFDAKFKKTKKQQQKQQQSALLNCMLEMLEKSRYKMIIKLLLFRNWNYSSLRQVKEWLSITGM